MPAAILKVSRTAHNYIGIFFAPTILFFAITGGLQMFSLHETTRGSSYTPPSILVHLAQLHKKGTLYVPPKKNAPSAAPKIAMPRTEAPKPEEAKVPVAPQPGPPNPLPIKIFFAATALSLVISTCTGLYMAWKYARRKAIPVFVFLAGIVFPLLALLL